MKPFDSTYPEQLLLVTAEYAPDRAGGRMLLSKINNDALYTLFCEKLVTVKLPTPKVDSLCERWSAFRGYIDGVDRRSLDFTIAMISSSRVSHVFVDGSNRGELVAQLKRRFPRVELITFFHNVEARFFLGSFRQRKTVHSIGVLLANYIAERKAVRYSDKIVCLSRRDSRLLHKLYGREATHIAPMVIEDRCPPSYLENMHQSPENLAIFVGGAFYANISGIRWFVRHVVPHIDVPIAVIGRGFADYRHELEIPGRVQVIGAVEDLTPWYQRAKFVIAPIFDGSGMKTKVAEALMYGKKIVGTPEAFSGYEEIIESAGWVCRDLKEFVAATKYALARVDQACNIDLRKIYEQLYSISAATERLKRILS